MLPLLLLASSGVALLVSGSCIIPDVQVLVNNSLVKEDPARICDRDYANQGYSNPFRCTSGDGYACCSDTEPIAPGMGLGECTPMTRNDGDEGGGEGKTYWCSDIPAIAQSCIPECGGSFDQDCCNNLAGEVTRWIPQCNNPGDMSNPGDTSTPTTQSSTKPMSDNLQKAVEIVPKFIGFLSLSGSSWIIFEVLSDSKKWRHIYHRIVLMMSAFDSLQALMWFMSTWPQNPEKSPVGIYSAGNDITCNLQGFVWQFSNGSTLCNAFLALYYVLLVRYNWSPLKIARKVERWFCSFIFLFTVGTSLAGLLLKLYNSMGLGCWVAPYPLDCKQSFKHGGASDCIRGDNANIYAWAFLICWVWACIFFATVAMFMMYRTVRKFEKRNSRYTFGSQMSQDRDRRRRQKTKQVAKSCFLYLGAFYVTWCGSLVMESWRIADPIVHPGINFYVVTTLPLQGFMNFLVYMRPRYLKYRVKNPDASMLLLAKKSMRKAIQKCRKADDDDDFEVMAEVPESFNSEFDNDAVNMEN